jgi:hypothetical protein
MSSLSPILKQRFFDQNGAPLIGGLLYTYVAGSAVPLVTYKDQTELVLNTNPIVLDSNGECDLWLGTTAYKFVLKNSLGVTQWTVDSVLASTGGGGGGGGGITSINGDVIAIGSGIVTATIQAGVVDNSKMADVPNLTLKGNISGVSAAPQDLTATEATSLLNVMVGDSGAGGVKGLVPAPLVGDAASGKFLKANGTWQSVPPGGITSLTTDVVASGSGAAAATIQAGVVTNSKLANIPAQRIKGNNTLSSATPLDLTPAEINAMLPVVTSTLNGLAPLSGGGTTNFLRADGTWAATPPGGITTLTTDVVASGSGSVTATIQAGVVSNSKLATMPTLTIKGNNTGGTTAPLDLTPAQLNAMLPVVTSTLNGLAPSSGGGTTNFLRADGTWTVPAGGVGTISSLTTDVVASGTGAVAATIQAGVVDNSKLATMPTLTIKGNNTGSTAAPLDLTVAQVKTQLNLTGTNSGDQTITLTSDVTGSGTGSFATTIASGVVSNSKLSTMPATTIKGNNTASTAAPLDLTPAQLNAMLPVVTSTLNGLAPASGGGTTNFLRADGTWAAAGTAGAITSLTTDVVTSGSGAATATIQAGVVTNSKLATMPTLTIKGNNTGSTAAPLDLTVAQVKTQLNLTGTNSGDQTITLTSDVTGTGTGSFATTIASGVVSNSKLATVPTLTLKGNKTGGTASPTDLTVAEVNTILPVVTSTLNGLAPLSGGGATNFLRADGTWAPTGINYISNFDASVNTTGWNTYADAAAAPVDGTGGTPTATFTRSTTSPLRGTGSFIYTPGALGNGASTDFTTESADASSMLTLEFDYLIGGTGYADGLVQVWLYDVTNSQLIQPTPYTLLNSSVPSKFRTQFQTNSNSTSYRLIIHQSTATSTYTVKLDSVKVGPSAYSQGVPLGDWTSYIPTIVSFGAVSGVSFFYRRVGDSVQIQGRFVAGSPTSVVTTVSLPTGLSTSSTKVVSTRVVGQVGLSSSGGSLTVCVLAQSGANYMNFGYRDFSFGVFTPRQGADMAFTGDTITVIAEFPIEGYYSNVLASSDSPNRVVALRASSLAAQTIGTSVTDYILETVDFDTCSMYNSATGEVTVPCPGIFEVTASYLTVAWAGSSGNDQELTLYKNGSSYCNLARDTDFNGASTLKQSKGSTLIKLVAGDKIKLVRRAAVATTQFSSSNVFNYLTVNLLQGPAQIQASETVACEYNTAAGGSVANSTLTYIDFGTKESDSHGSVLGAGSGNVTVTNTGWRFITPSSGRYQIDAVVGVLTAASTSTDVFTNIYVNNVQIQQGSRYQVATSGGGSLMQSQVSGLVRLNAGDRVEIAFLQGSGATRNLNAASSNNRVSICKLGGY